MREKMERFAQYMDVKGLNDNQVTIQCELSKGLLGQARKGKSDIGQAAVDKILRTYQDLSRVWLLTGEGPMLTDGSSSVQYQASFAPASADGIIDTEASDVPVIPAEAVRSQGTDVVKWVASNRDKVRFTSMSELMPTYDMIFRALSNAMYPDIIKGDLLALKIVPPEFPIVDGEIYAVDTVSGLIVRRVIVGENNTYIFRAQHPQYPDMVVPRENIYNMFIVVSLVRSSIAPAPISSAAELAKKDKQIDELQRRVDILTDENIRYGSRIDKLLSILEKQ